MLRTFNLLGLCSGLLWFAQAFAYGHSVPAIVTDTILHAVIMK